MDCSACRALAGVLTGGREPERALTDVLGEALGRGASMGRYLILSLIGRGGMGEVYAAYDPELDRRVALKLLHTAQGSESNRRRLVREARMLGKLSHPNVVQVYDAGEHRGDVFIAMELVEGQALGAWCGGDPAPAWQEVLDAYLDAARGLAAAHAKGLIHRDVKPSNILRGADGRVRIADFGLAAASERPPREEPAPRSPPAASDDAALAATWAAPLTATGAIVGTPLYMAPEQLDGERGSPASDQYSLCTALYQGLYGVLPFSVGPDGGFKLGEILAQKRAGAPASPPDPSPVPAWIHKVLAVGLAPRPEDRHLSVAALIAALTRTPRAGRRGLGLAAGLTVGVALIAGVAHQVQVRRQLCSGGEQKVGEIWNPPVRERARAAFLATAFPDADRAWDRVEQVVSEYGRGWVKQYTESCEASRLRGEQSDEVLDLRMTCLAQHLQEVKASVDLLANADRQVVEKSLAMASGLAPLAECADVEALEAPVRPPRDAQTREQVAALRGDLARAKALQQGGKYGEGLSLAEQALAGANRLAYDPLKAEALTQLGDLQAAARRDALAEKNLEDAFATALSSHHDALAGRASLLLAGLVGTRMRNFAMGDQWARTSAALTQRMHAGPAEQASLHQTLGKLAATESAAMESRFDDAVVELRLALGLWEQAVGSEHRNVAVCRAEIGTALWRHGKLEEGLAELRHALEIQEKVLGPEHPDVASIREQIGLALSEQGKNDEALRELQRALTLTERALTPESPRAALLHDAIGYVYSHEGKLTETVAAFQRALAIQEKTLEPDHIEIATTLNNIGVVLFKAGRLEEADAALHRALDITVKLEGPDHPDTVSMHINLAAVFTHEGRNEEAVAELRTALALSEKALGPETVQAARCHNNLGDVLNTLNRTDEALAELHRALAIQEKLVGADSPNAAQTLGNIGEVDLKRHALPEAMEHLGRALSILEAKRPDPLLLGEFRFELARARWEADKDRPAAVALARQARADYGKLSDRRKEAAEVDGWLAKHAP